MCLEVDTLDDAIELVNNNHWGNGTAIFTNSGAAARKYQHEIEAGQVFCLKTRKEGRKEGRRRIAVARMLMFP